MKKGNIRGIEYFNKLPYSQKRLAVSWSDVTGVEIYQNGVVYLDQIPYPSTPGAYMTKELAEYRRDADHKFPSYCCQKCGECIGWLGRFFQFLRFNIHTC